MEIEKMRQMILEDPDFISLKRFDFSIKNLLKRYPESAPPHVAAQALLLTEEEFETEYTRVVEKLKSLIL
jgi:hypothetical protein